MPKKHCLIWSLDYCGNKSTCSVIRISRFFVRFSMNFRQPKKVFFFWGGGDANSGCFLVATSLRAPKIGNGFKNARPATLGLHHGQASFGKPNFRSIHFGTWAHTRQWAGMWAFYTGLHVMHHPRRDGSVGWPFLHFGAVM